MELTDIMKDMLSKIYMATGKEDIMNLIDCVYVSVDEDSNEVYAELKSEYPRVWASIDINKNTLMVFDDYMSCCRQISSKFMKIVAEAAMQILSEV